MFVQAVAMLRNLFVAALAAWIWKSWKENTQVISIASLGFKARGWRHNFQEGIIVQN